MRLGHSELQIPLSICLLTGALGMILIGVMSIDEAYEAVDWMTVFLSGGPIPLELAFQKTGTVEFIPISIMNALGTLPSIIFLAVTWNMTFFFTLMVSKLGATVLLVSLAISMAVRAGGAPNTAAFIVAFFTSSTFVLPTHQVNALWIMPRPGPV